MPEKVSKSPLQEKRLYLLHKFNYFINRRAYTFSTQMKITYKNRNNSRNVYFKEI